MFAAYSQVRLIQEYRSWVLLLNLNKALWLVFLIFPIFVVLGKGSISSLGISDLVPSLALPAAIFSGSVFWSRIRISRCWERL
jgi:uncharacterized membrane protein YcaP (DUF421 family)